MKPGIDDQPSPIELQPVIAELLRTCIHPELLLLRVDRVVNHHVEGQDYTDSEGTTEDQRRSINGYATKLWLTDRQLSIQALLHRRLADHVDATKIQEGDLVEIYNFKVKKAKKKDGLGRVVYLGIDDCHFVGHSTEEHQRIARLVASQNLREERAYAPSVVEHGHEISKARGLIRNDQPCDGAPKTVSFTETALPTVSSPAQSITRNDSDVARASRLLPSTFARTSTLKRIRVEDEEEEVFQTVAVNPRTAKKRRRALHELQANIVPSPVQLSQSPQKTSFNTTKSYVSLTPSSTDQKTVNVRQHQYHRQAPLSQLPTANLVSSSTKSPHQKLSSTAIPSSSTISTPMPVADHKSQATLSSSTPVAGEPPFHNLLSILHPAPSHPLPRKNYSFTTLAIITYVGPNLISRPGSPFPPKRHIKIEDPSLHLSSDGNNKAITGNGALGIQDKRGAGLTVSVYRSASSFKPSFGTLALFRALVMQRLHNGDVVLNVYPKKQDKSSSTSLPRSQRGGRQLEHEQGHERGNDVCKDEITPDMGFSGDEWFISDLDRLRTMGYPVDEVSAWWDRRMKGEKQSDQ